MSGIQSIDSPKWRDLKIGDILTLEYGKALQDYRNGNGDFDVFGTNGKIGVTETYLHDEPSLIIGRKGAYRGVHLAKLPFFVIDTAFYTKNKLEDLDVVYLYYWFKCIDINSMDSGSAIPSTSRDEVYDLDILLPPIEEQKTIASVLSSLDDKINLLHRQNKTLEAMAETLFRQWFVEEAQEDWEEKPLSFFGNIICGKTPPKNNADYFGGNMPFIKIPDMHGQTFIFGTTDTLTELGRNYQKNKTLPARSICVSCIATVGLVSMNIVESQTNQQINSIVPKKDFYRYFLYLYIKSSTETLQALASGGTATMNLNTGDFSKILIPYRGDDLLIAFNQSVHSFFEKIFANQKQINTLETLRDTLLPKLMSGEVRVDYP